MASFSNFVQRIFGELPEPEPELDPSNPDSAPFMVKAKHKLSGETYSWLFDSQADLNEFMQAYCPTAHLNYIRTEVYRMNGNLPELIERHEHFTGNIEYETQRFNEEAESLGIPEPSIVTYANVSSAVTAVAYFA